MHSSQQHTHGKGGKGGGVGAAADDVAQLFAGRSAYASSDSETDARAVAELLRARIEARPPQLATRIGSTALVLVNPVSPQLAAAAAASSAANLSLLLDTSAPPNALPPHIAALANSVFFHMLREQHDQSVLFLGETGSGKSEARKQFTAYICSLSKSSKKKSKVISGVTKSEMLLDAFGHATTIDNPNSSRFGRYTEYQFDDRGKLMGAKLLTYLLEKSRVVNSNHEDGRNFHAFYWLLAGALPEERNMFYLQDALNFPCLTPPKGSKVSVAVRNSSTDAANFQILRENMKSVGIGKRQQSAIFQALAAILHLSTITFMDDPNKVNEACEVKNHESLAHAASLLGVDAVNLEYSLTYKTKLIRKELCTIYLNASDAGKQRDSLATTLYSLVFEWIVEHLNTRLDHEDCSTFIGTLDLSGFQDYKVNKFEQLLYNFANEKLHAHYRHRAFDESHAEYMSESITTPMRNPSAGLPKTPTDSLKLFTGGEKDVAGMIPLIEAESQRAALKGDAHLINVFNEKLQSNPCFAASLKPGATATIFSVRHYAGLVEYDASGLSERNIDAAIATDFISLFRGNGADVRPSENSFVRSLFSGSGVQSDANGEQQLNMSPMRKPSVKNLPQSSSAKTVGKEDRNIAAAFDASLNELFSTLSDTVSWQIFCIKPNEDLVDDEFDIRTVAGQLGYMYIPQLAQSKTWDYTSSMTFDDFKTRYRLIVEPLGLDMSHGTKALCREYVNATNRTQKEIAVGNSRVFFSESVFRSIENELLVIEKAIHDEVKAQRKSQTSSSSNGDRSRTGKFNDDESVSGSAYYDDGSFADELESHFESEFQFNPSISGKGTPGDIEMGRLNANRFASGSTAPLLTGQGNDEEKGVPAKKKMSRSRCRWVALTWCLTFWVPSPCLSLCGMKRPDIRMAWREKLALCILIMFMCALMLFFIIGFGMLICPAENVYSAFELSSYTSITDPWVYANGIVYRIGGIVSNHYSAYNIAKYNWDTIVGLDVSSYFYKNQNFGMYCPGLTTPESTWDNLATRTSGLYAHNATSTDGTMRHYLEFMNQYAVARVAWPMSYISSEASETNKLIVIYDNVYDVSNYFNGDSNNFLNDNMQTLFGNFYGKDATSAFKQVKETEGAAQAAMYLTCMNNMFYIGTIDHRDDISCQVSNGILLTATIILCLVIGVKFISALQFGTPKDPEEHDKFVICQIPCYTEDAESLTDTLESIALLRYDDKRKLIFVVCDGMIIGSGNDRPTPRIVLDILGVDPMVDPDLLSFDSLGEGDRQHNMGKVYSGLYEVQGHNVPFIVVVKCGKPSERQRPGNRGKRDSQMVLMRFLNRVHFNGEMNPLELEMYHHMKNIIGVNPSFYEYILMVDADTVVYPESLNRMVSAMIDDSRIMGICGETLISNEKDSFFTMIQVYEYFISHHLAKAFESLFGSVTCLPGCFCMYRVRTPTKNIPLLVSQAVVDGYSENDVETLHMKNLLHLGEDRYLTTLMMKHFPKYKLTFTADAQCKTSVPDRWAVLLSQRRRWINSTVHNLIELVSLPQLCGFCCFSMRFIVFFDLISTAVQPASIIYIGYLIYSVIATNNKFPLISVVMIAAIYGLQVIIFLIRREWAQIAWMLLYIMATPVFAFYVPLYAFWHFDDFSWGNTRVVVGDKGKKILAADVVPFDPTSIPRRRWADFEKEAFEKPGGSHNGAPSIYSDSGRGRVASGLTLSQYQQQQRLSFVPPPASTFGGASTMYPASAYGVPAGYMAANPGGAAVMSYQQGGMPGAVPSGMPPGYFAGYAESMAGGVILGSQAGGIAAVVPGGEPSDEQLLFEIRRILSTADLMTVTKKQVRDELSAVFRMDMTSRKALINQYIEEILQGRL
ncbi:hypothetical protein HK100_009642 [Physocladia obscura]|uniref:chitin synthase n=1 Tax=Physocladia obscura TaxID=109957 RepID=A0AAD5XHW7_9FUNG|nr:hypothetical protein HK100_009642 [Physocladia obscura]